MLRFISSHHKLIKGIIVTFFSLLVLVDIALVILGDYPTFSQVFKWNRGQLIWMTFLYGGLVAKVFYFKVTTERIVAVRGTFKYCSIVILIFILGQILTIEVGNIGQIFLLFLGGLLAYLIWPQYRFTRI